MYRADRRGAVVVGGTRKLRFGKPIPVAVVSRTEYPWGDTLDFDFRCTAAAV
jgi:hypothetical protein